VRKDNKTDRRTAFYIVYDQSDDPPSFKGYAPMGKANVARINENFIITKTVMLSKFAVRKARSNGMIYG